MHVCVCVCAHVCGGGGTHTVHVCVCVCAHVCGGGGTHTVHVCVCVCAHVCGGGGTHTVHVCVCVCAHVCGGGEPIQCFASWLSKIEKPLITIRIDSSFRESAAFATDNQLAKPCTVQCFAS